MAGSNGGQGGASGHSRGAAIFNAGILHITDATFTNNQADGSSYDGGPGGVGGPGGNSDTGALGGHGGQGGAGGDGSGGAIYNAGSMMIAKATFGDAAHVQPGNAARGSKGGPGGQGGSGGAGNSAPTTEPTVAAAMAGRAVALATRRSQAQRPPVWLHEILRQLPRPRPRRWCRVRGSERGPRGRWPDGLPGPLRNARSCRSDDLRKRRLSDAQGRRRQRRRARYRHGDARTSL